MSTTIGAYEAKTHLAALLDRVERGESLTITRNGRSVARLVPPAASPSAPDVAAAMADLDALRARIASYAPAVTWEELKKDRDAGRR